MQRRRFLQGLGLAIAPGATLVSAPAARAQSNEYRALVCVFLYGGNDGLNMLPPPDADGHGRYAAVRGNLAIARNSIIGLDGEVGLHPSLAPLKSIWDESRLAVVHNVGPLARPTTVADYQTYHERGDIARIPDKLFSHADQQILWQNAHTETQQLRGGWGGRLMENRGAAPVLTFGGSSRFGSGRLTSEVSMPGPGAQLGLQGYWDGAQPSARQAALMTLLNQGGPQTLARHYAGIQRDALAQAAVLGPILRAAPSGGSADSANAELSAAFNHLSGGLATPLAGQLYQVAKLIKQRSALGGGSQIFFVSQGGYDTHANQLGTHANLLADLGQALAAFWNGLKAIGADDAVTLFTESDFGRTFRPNTSGGTDHAWGSPQLVLGGAVRGGRSYGSRPSLQLGGADDAAASVWDQQGRWIPGISVAQYANVLIDWFAPGTTDKAALLPTLANFTADGRDLDFLAAT